MRVFSKYLMLTFAFVLLATSSWAQYYLPRAGAKDDPARDSATEQRRSIFIRPKKEEKDKEEEKSRIFNRRSLFKKKEKEKPKTLDEQILEQFGITATNPIFDIWSQTRNQIQPDTYFSHDDISALTGNNPQCTNRHQKAYKDVETYLDVLGKDPRRMNAKDQKLRREFNNYLESGDNVRSIVELYTHCQDFF